MNSLEFVTVPLSKCPVNHVASMLAELSLSHEDETYHSELLPSASFDDLYSPLQPYQIRLLRVEPGNDDALIETRLMNVDLLDYEGVLISETREWTTYEAVSYSWGYPEPTHVVSCNEQLIPVLKTQFEMLRSFRGSSRPRYLWIDAICINQSDKDEKSSQIRKMLSI